MKVYLSIGLLLVVFVLSGCQKSMTTAPDNSAVKAETVESSTVNNPQIVAAQKIIEKFPDEPQGYVQLATGFIRLARETGDFGLNGQAEKAIEKALSLNPQDEMGRKIKASLHLTFHRFPEALELGKKLQSEFPEDSFVYGVLTDAHVELGNYREAVENAQKMVDLKPQMSSFVRVAHLRSLHGDFKGAVEMYKTAARIADPKDKESQSWCLVQLADEFRRNGKYDEAEKVYDEALQNFPDYYLALAGKGAVAVAKNDFEKASTFLNQAFNRFPNVETAILLGDIYSVQGNLEKAKEQYDLAEFIEQKNGINNDQKRIALLWADQERRLDEALTIAQREYQIRKDIFTADALAWTLYKKGNLTEAQKVVSKALHLNSNDARIIYHAGMIEKDLGNNAQAKELLEKALKLNPKFDLLQAEKAQKALSQLK